jgi:hypothetical protein
MKPHHLIIFVYNVAVRGVRKLQLIEITSEVFLEQLSHSCVIFTEMKAIRGTVHMIRKSLYSPVNIPLKCLSSPLTESATKQ